MGYSFGLLRSEVGETFSEGVVNRCKARKS
jgi:hypothetical protein